MTTRIDNETKDRGDTPSIHFWDLAKVTLTSLALAMGSAGCSGIFDSGPPPQLPQPAVSSILRDSGNWIGRHVAINGKLEFRPELTTLDVAATTNYNIAPAPIEAESTPPQVTYHLHYDLLGEDSEGNQISLPVVYSFSQTAMKFNISIRDLAKVMPADAAGVVGEIKASQYSGSPYLVFQSYLPAASSADR